MGLPAPHRSNCLVWAWCMRLLFGGRIKPRWSHNYPGPHFIWVSPEGDKWSYSPVNPIWPIPYNLLWFRGKVVAEA